MNETTALKTRRKQARYADKELINGMPVAVIKSGKTKDFLTLQEFAEDLYGKKIERIVFCKN